MGSSRSIKSARSATSARSHGWPNDPFAAPRFQPEIVSPLSFDGAAQARSIRSARSMNSTRNGWPEDASATGFPTTPRDDELVSPLVWQVSDFPPASPASLRGSVRTITPFSSSQSVHNGTGSRPITPVAHPSPLSSGHGWDSPRAPQFAARNMEEYRASSRPSTPSAYSNADARSIANSMVPVAGGYRSPSVRSRTATNLSHPVHNQSETHRSRKITITTTTTIDLPPDYNPANAIFLAPTAPPPQGYHMDPSGWSLSTTGSRTGPGQNEAAFNVVQSEYDCATLQGSGHHARSAKGHRVRHGSHRAPSHVGAHSDIHDTAPASRPLDRQSHMSRPDRRRSRSYSDLQSLASANKYSRYALPAHERAVTINNSQSVEAEGKKPSTGAKKGGLSMIQQLFKR
ncbi:hypothetical protein BJ912DRAFT_1058046 [Pholiota molesta]|nr:hypothetical protein BJ912DRAFT_1058046 [Pholiota molesta]